MPSIADLFISVSSDVGGAITGLTDVDRKLNGTTSAMQAAAPAAYALAAASAVVGGAFVVAVGEAASFEKQMSGVKAVMSPAEVQTYGAALSQLALTLGKETTFSASQAAGAIEELVKAGVPIQTVLDGGAKAALSLAAATGTDVRSAATFAGIALNTFHLDASQLTRTVDTLAGVANASAADIGDLRLAFSAVGPVASALGLSFDDTAIALGAFADNGLRGSDAGTSLKTMLLNLQPSTKAQIQAFTELGLITADGSNQFFDASGNAKSMGEIFEILKQSTANLTNEQKINLLQTAFGTDAVRAATIAANLGAEGFDNLATNVGKISAADSAKTRLDNLAGSLEQLGGSFETVQITIGNLFLPVLRGIVDAATGVLNAFLNLDPTIQTLIIAAVGIAGAIAGVVAGFILLGPVLSAAGAAFGIIFAAAAPITVPLLAIAAAAAALYLAWQSNFGGIRDVTAQVWEAIQPAFVNIQNFINALGAELGPAFSGAASAAAPFIQALSDLLAPLLAQIPGMVRAVGDAFNLLGPPLQSIFEIIRMLATGDFRGGIFGLAEDSGLVTFFLTLHDAIALFFDAVLKLLQGDFSGAWESLWGSFTTILGGVATAVPQILETVRDAIGSFLQALPGWVAQNMGDIWFSLRVAFLNLFLTVGPIWNDFAGWLGNVVSGIPQFVSDRMGDIWFSLLSAFHSLVTTVIPAWNEFAGWFGSVLGGIPQFVIDKAGDIWGKLREAFEGIVGQLLPAWNVFADWLAAVAGGIPQFVIDSAGDVWGKLREAFDGIVGQLEPAWNTFADWLAGVAGGIPQWVIDKAGDIWGKLREAFEGIVDQLQPAWDAFADWLAAVCGGIPQFVIDKAGDVFGGLVKAFDGIVGALTPAWEEFTKWFQTLLEGIPQFVIDHIGDVFGGLVKQAGELVQQMKDALGPLADWLAETFGNFWNWLVSGGTVPSAPPSDGGGGTGGGGIGGGGPIVSVGTLIISSQEEAKAFLDLVAEAVLASARRVSPPIAGSNPAL